MLGKLVPLLIGLVGLGAGVGAAVALRPAPPAATEYLAADNPCGDVAPRKVAAPKPTEPTKADSEFVKLANQFVFPLVEDGSVAALVVISLSLEVALNQTDAVFLREPKLRDGFLRVMLDHANAGGFEGAFTQNSTMDKLRIALLEKGRETLGEALYDVLILDINRQDT